ncbi:MAG: EVE domain-containing protein, partial [Methylococcaceae bacterium]
PDFTAFDPDDAHFDPKSDPDKPRWMMVDVRFVKTLSRTISLRELKARPELVNMAVVRPGNRLSIMPVSANEWQFILGLEQQDTLL